MIVATTDDRDRDRELVERLKDRGVAVSARWSKGIGGVRWSLHGMTTAADLERASVALDAVI
jgi:selenocysteine lyase/cysteine desulfurase